MNIKDLNLDVPYTVSDNNDGSRTVHTRDRVYVLPAPAQSPQPARLDQLTRAELYALAQKRDISGRGSMSKAQLLTALQEEQDEL